MILVLHLWILRRENSAEQRRAQLSKWNWNWTSCFSAEGKDDVHQKESSRIKRLYKLKDREWTQSLRSRMMNRRTKHLHGALTKKQREGLQSALTRSPDQPDKPQSWRAKNNLRAGISTTPRHDTFTDTQTVNTDGTFNRIPINLCFYYKKRKNKHEF